ncbi:thermonuclease family protein [Aestuariivirga sp.]|uniref:thermonuclease family protein n=1 Tax=Aestuariivirga sp. TaxID=2650926 RepID=UPI0035940EE6
MSRSWQRGRTLLRNVKNVLVLMAVLAMAALAARQAGWLAPESGTFTAIDGDSLRKGAQEFRLHAIDAPELHQTCTSSAGRDYPCGREARDALRKLVKNKPLDCRIIETDRYGRLVAQCRAETLDINGELVRLGWAIAYRQHGRDYVDEEAEAKEARHGIWQGAFDIPEAWRRTHRDSLVRGGLSGESPPD